MKIGQKSLLTAHRVKYRDIALAIKAEDISEQGNIVGYASLFGVKDSYGDIVMPGAFKKSLQSWGKQKAMPPMLFAHDTKQPIGIHNGMVEDSKGLLVDGQLALGKGTTDDPGVARAREAYTLLKMGALKGMSIGYICTEWTTDSKADSCELNTIDLWENSLVVFPACPGAGTTAVKNNGDAATLPTSDEFLHYLREAGFSKEQAELIARKGFDALLAKHASRPIANQSALADVFSSRYGA